jgi:transposase
MLVHQRTEWQQRMHAVLYHHGVPHARKLLTLANRERVAALKLPAVATERLTIALEMIDAIDVQIGPVDVALRAYARTQPGCGTLIKEIYGIGPLTSVTILAELGDTRRFQNSRDAVRYGAMDVTVYQSDQRRAAGHLSRQGPPALRWALYEAAQAARRPSSPDRPYYEHLAALGQRRLRTASEVRNCDRPTPGRSDQCRPDGLAMSARSSWHAGRLRAVARRRRPSMSGASIGLLAFTAITGLADIRPWDG